MLHSDQASSLAARVKKLTQDDHRSAETASFITELMGRKLSTREYAMLVSQYHYIYQALDAAVEQFRDNATAPSVVRLFDPKLDRRTAIVKTLQTLLPECGLPLELTELSSTAAYAQRIRDVAEDPARLAAHHYLRYLGDLSGGLAIARLMQRHYRVHDHQLNMYTFKSISKPKLYKDAYRDKLNSLGFTPEQQDDFIDEAALGFQCNKAMFEELGSYCESLTPIAV